MSKVETLKERKALLEILCDVIENLERDQKYMLKDYRAIGEEQRTDDDNNPIFNEDGSPKMRNIYDYVDISIDELSPEQKKKYGAYTTAIALISKLG